VRRTYTAHKPTLSGSPRLVASQSGGGAALAPGYDRAGLQPAITLAGIVMPPWAA